jgi:hypothetical protein
MVEQIRSEDATSESGRFEGVAGRTAEQGDNKKRTRSTRPLCDVAGPETDLDSRTGPYIERAVSPSRPLACYVSAGALTAQTGARRSPTKGLLTH